MSTFTNITVTDTATADTIVCNTLVTNTALSSTSYGGITVPTNTIIPYSGNTITINGPIAMLNTLDINSANVIMDGNLNVLGTTFTKNINAGISTITAGNLISNNIVSTLLTLSNLSIGNIVSDVNILGTTFTKNINAATSNITAGNIILTGSLLGLASLTTNGNINAGNVNSNYADINRLFVGISSSYTQSSGTALVMSQNSVFDNTVNGSISGNVYPQFSFGSGREHLFATDVGNANISYYGISDLVAPDSDFMITYKNKVGMKISPTLTNTDFTEALRVVGTANISGNIDFGGNIDLGGNIYQTYTLNSPINSSIHTAYIEPCLNDTSKNVVIKGESATTGATIFYGAGVFSYADTYIDKGLHVGTGVSLGLNGSKLIVNKGSDLYGNTSVIGNLSVSTFANISTLRATGNTVVGYNTLNRKIKMGAIDATTQRISFYGSSNIIGENLNGYIEIDGETNGATTQNRGALNIVCGNITMGSILGQSFILYNKNVEIQGNINALSKLDVLGNTTVANLKFSDIFNTNVRIGEAWGPIMSGAVVTIASGGFIPVTAPVYGTLDGIDATGRWIRVNKNGQSLTVGVKFTFHFETNAGFTNSTSGDFQVETSTTSTFTTAVGRTLTRVLGTFVSSQITQRTLDFILPTTEEYFRIKYTGNSAWTFVGGQASGYLSRYSVRTYL